MPDVIIAGGGHNGLVAAAFLAKAGLKPLVLERAEHVGGCASTLEIAPGFRCPALSHVAALDPSIVRALGLERHGLRILRPPARVCAPTRDGRALVLWSDVSDAAKEIGAFSSRDAARFPPFLVVFARLAAAVRALTSSVLPRIDPFHPGEVIEALRTGRRFRALGKPDGYRLLQWMSMPVADLVEEWFESEPLGATIAAGGVLGAFVGPRSPGTAARLLLLAGDEGTPLGAGWFAVGGTGAVADTLAVAARHAGAEIRTLAEVVRITIVSGAASGVVLADGQEIGARAIVSNTDPKRTFLGLVDPVHLGADFVRRVQNIRMHGVLAKVNYAVTSLPRLLGASGRDVNQQRAALSGRVRLNASLDSIERAFDAAKYGRLADEPWIELTIPSLVDDSLATGDQHVVSAYVQFAPYRLRGGSWEAERDALRDRVTRTIESYAPGFEASIIHADVITPDDLERRYGLTGGDAFHGELALDQLFFARPLLGWARYRTPIRNLYLCGAGTHPGTGLDGRSGALAAKAIVRDLR